MAKNYGDIACTKINNKIHITISGTKCLCGKEWTYGKPSNRDTLEMNNIIWRDIEAVTCDRCIESWVNSR